MAPFRFPRGHKQRDHDELARDAGKAFFSAKMETPRRFFPGALIIPGVQR